MDRFRFRGKPDWSRIYPQKKDFNNLINVDTPVAEINDSNDSNDNKVSVGGSGPIDFVLSKLKKELHIYSKDLKRKYNFAGPGTKLEKRLGPNDIPHEWSKPINKLDEAAYHHDIAYRDHKTAKERHPYDIALAKVATK